MGHVAADEAQNCHAEDNVVLKYGSQVDPFTTLIRKRAFRRKAVLSAIKHHTSS